MCSRRTDLGDELPELVEIGQALIRHAQLADLAIELLGALERVQLV